MTNQIFTPRPFITGGSESLNDNRTRLNYYFFSPPTGSLPGIFFHPRKSIKEENIETEGPLSEKDEVKKAEQRTMEQQKKVEKQQPAKRKK